MRTLPDQVTNRMIWLNSSIPSVIQVMKWRHSEEVVHKVVHSFLLAVVHLLVQPILLLIELLPIASHSCCVSFSAEFVGFLVKHRNSFMNCCPRFSATFHRSLSFWVRKFKPLFDDLLPVAAIYTIASVDRRIDVHDQACWEIRNCNQCLRREEWVDLWAFKCVLFHQDLNCCAGKRESGAVNLRFSQW